MRIAYVLASLGRGGAERQVVSLAERMASRGHHVLLIVLKSEPGTIGAPRLKSFGQMMQNSLPGICSGLARARGQLHSFRPDVVHSHTFPANMAREFFTLAIRACRTFHDS